MSRRWFLAAAVTGAAGALLRRPPAVRGAVHEFVFVPHAPLTALDPVWTPAHATRNHGYLIYDTLFGVDDRGRIQPQTAYRRNVVGMLSFPVPLFWNIVDTSQPSGTG